jgi:predicted DNA-binding protein YlxM (UPF0122 family)
MNKLKLAKQAQKLYEIENLNADEISKKLEISRRTIFNWIKRFNWKNHKINIAEIQNTFPLELQQLASRIINKVSDDIDKKRKLSNEELYSIANIVEHINKFQKQVAKEISPKENFPKNLTPELIQQIQKDILGI